MRGFLLAFFALALFVPAVALGQDDHPRVLAVHLDNDINPVTQEYLENAIDRGEDEEFDAVVVILDTPGGLSSSMRGIVKRFLASTVPVILYVSPPGSSASNGRPDGGRCSIDATGRAKCRPAEARSAAGCQGS